MRDDQLIISGERRPLSFSPEHGRLVRDEFKYGRFERIINLPPRTEVRTFLSLNQCVPKC